MLIMTTDDTNTMKSRVSGKLRRACQKAISMFKHPFCSFVGKLPLDDEGPLPPYSPPACSTSATPQVPSPASCSVSPCCAATPSLASLDSSSLSSMRRTTSSSIAPYSSDELDITTVTLPIALPVAASGVEEASLAAALAAAASVEEAPEEEASAAVEEAFVEAPKAEEEAVAVVSLQEAVAEEPAEEEVAMEQAAAEEPAEEVSCPACPQLFRPQALQAGLFCEKGVRATNEDRAFTMELGPVAQHEHAEGLQQGVCFGVFDGHGGAEVAEYLAERLPEVVTKRSKNIKEQGVGELSAILRSTEVELRVRYGTQWQAAGRDPGSTALVATIMDDALLVANVGDCRLLLVSEGVDDQGNRTAAVAKATRDHHCARNPEEADRVCSAGAHVDADGYIGSMLEVSRSIGDFQTKAELGEGVILAEPEAYTWQLGPQDLLAVAVSDGISGSMSDAEICSMVCKLLNERKHLNDPAYAARELANFAVAKGSSDNCSAVVLLLKEQPPPEPARRRLFARK